MTKAFILISTAPGTAQKYFDLIKRKKWVQSVHLVTPPYDMIATVDVEDPARMADIITSRIVLAQDNWGCVVCFERSLN